MAEFQEVMKQAKRMCEAFGRTSCDGCPVSGIEKTCVLAYAPDFTNEEQMAKVECCVMDWAAKNPELRYPTWSEWQGANFQMAERAICAAHFMDAGDAGCYTPENNCDKCRDRPIPADIAEKLGIKPMGGEEDA